MSVIKQPFDTRAGMREAVILDGGIILRKRYDVCHDNRS